MGGSSFWTAVRAPRRTSAHACAYHGGRDGDEGHRRDDGDLDEVGDVALFLADGGTSVLYIY